LRPFVTWTIFVAKFIELFIAKRRLRAAVDAVARARTLGEAQSMLSSDQSVMRSFITTAINEVALSPDLDNESGLKERIASSFSEIARSEARRVRFGMGALATIGATAPFIGLFGTVWGIMHSFIGISKLQTTKPRGCCTGHRRGASRNGHRPVRGHPGGDDLQPFLARHERLSRSGGAGGRHGHASTVARSRPHARGADTPRGGVVRS
jgi:hypothetical protein